MASTEFNVILIIRCAHQTAQDQTVCCPSNWTVLQLKSHLEDVHPNSPKPTQQRLIYHGYLLKDTDMLSKILRSYSPGSEHIIHLVYTPTAEELRRSRANQTAADSVSSPSNLLPTPSETPNSDLRHRTSTTATSPPFTNFLPTATVTPGVNYDWMMQSQQMYAAYMHNYFNYLNQVYGTVYPQNAFQMGATFVQQGVTPSAFGQAPAVVNEPVNVNVANNAQEPPRAAQPEPAMNAQGGLDEDDEWHERDWLDYIYIGCRGALLFMILYFYSSVERFVFVVICVGLVWAYQNGYFGGLAGPNARRVQNDEPPPVAAAAEPGEQVPPPVPEQNNEINVAPIAQPEGPDAIVNAETDTPNEQADTTPPPPVHPFANMTPWQVFWTTCHSFLTGFFASLIPDRPPPIQLN